MGGWLDWWQRMSSARTDPEFTEFTAYEVPYPESSTLMAINDREVTAAESFAAPWSGFPSPSFLAMIVWMVDVGEPLEVFVFIGRQRPFNEWLVPSRRSVLHHDRRGGDRHSPRSVWLVCRPVVICRRAVC